MLQSVLAQLPTQSENCSGPSQKLSFSHSYKIDVPKSSQIKVEPLQDDSSHMLLYGGETDEAEEQNIIFRHNIRLQTPKGNCEGLGQLQALLERIEKMEVEVVHLREACSPQRCCGRGQGENCATSSPQHVPLQVECSKLQKQEVYCPPGGMLSIPHVMAGFLLVSSQIAPVYIGTISFN